MYWSSIKFSLVLLIPVPFTNSAVGLDFCSLSARDLFVAAVVFLAE